MSVKTLLYTKVCLAPPLFNTVHVVALPPPENNLILKLPSKRIYPIFSIAKRSLAAHSFNSLTLTFTVSSSLFVKIQSKIISYTGKITSDTAKITSDTAKITSDTTKITSDTTKITSDTTKIIFYNYTFSI